MCQTDGFLKKIAGPRKRLRILLHLDEHCKMCDRNKDNVNEAKKGAMFSRGALEALTSVLEVTVIATYTERPPLPAHASSTVCHYPVTFPRLDVKAAMQEIEELHFPPNLNIQCLPRCIMVDVSTTNKAI